MRRRASLLRIFSVPGSRVKHIIRRARPRCILFAEQADEHRDGLGPRRRALQIKIRPSGGVGARALEQAEPIKRLGGLRRLAFRRRRYWQQRTQQADCQQQRDPFFIADSPLFRFSLS